ncbi:hypothetical protein [Psychrobacter sp. I-STPA6b]|uniref:hypothetical protein n=1 Tax=Psychrobacter sp. I-STPA6b TaxID=2585718 RepID=UPI001D0C02B7|nr:hypothetical protein [Psychrobacter sp. I-STPA6b]
MSLDVYLMAKPINQDDNDCLYSANITHNLNDMARFVGIYKHLWRPEELNITQAKELIEPLHAGFLKLLYKAEDCKKFNPENDWGDYDWLFSFVKNYLQACMDYPEAYIEVDR